MYERNAGWRRNLVLCNVIELESNVHAAARLRLALAGSESVHSSPVVDDNVACVEFVSRQPLLCLQRCGRLRWQQIAAARIGVAFAEMRVG